MEKIDKLLGRKTLDFRGRSLSVQVLVLEEMLASAGLNVDAVACMCLVNNFRQHAAACARHP